MDASIVTINEYKCYQSKHVECLSLFVVIDGTIITKDGIKVKVNNKFNYPTITYLKNNIDVIDIIIETIYSNVDMSENCIVYKDGDSKNLKLSNIVISSLDKLANKLRPGVKYVIYRHKCILFKDGHIYNTKLNKYVTINTKTNRFYVFGTGGNIIKELLYHFSNNKLKDLTRYRFDGLGIGFNSIIDNNNNPISKESVYASVDNIINIFKCRTCGYKFYAKNTYTILRNDKNCDMCHRSNTNKKTTTVNVNIVVDDCCGTSCARCGTGYKNKKIDRCVMCDCVEFINND